MIIVANFAHGDKEMYRSIREQLRGKEIGILINNVGVMYEHPAQFLDVKEDVRKFSN